MSFSATHDIQQQQQPRPHQNFKDEQTQEAALLEQNCAASFHEAVGMAFSHMFDAAIHVVVRAETHVKEQLESIDRLVESAEEEKRKVDAELETMLRVLEENKRAIHVIYSAQRAC